MSACLGTLQSVTGVGALLAPKRTSDRRCRFRCWCTNACASGRSELSVCPSSAASLPPRASRVCRTAECDVTRRPATRENNRSLSGALIPRLPFARISSQRFFWALTRGRPLRRARSIASMAPLVARLTNASAIPTACLWRVRDWVPPSATVGAGKNDWSSLWCAMPDSVAHGPHRPSEGGRAPTHRSTSTATDLRVCERALLRAWGPHSMQLRRLQSGQLVIDC